jgi:hypothetical protein
VPPGHNRPDDAPAASAKIPCRWVLAAFRTCYTAEEHARSATTWFRE